MLIAPRLLPYFIFTGTITSSPGQAVISPIVISIGGVFCNSFTLTFQTCGVPSSAVTVYCTVFVKSV